MLWILLRTKSTKSSESLPGPHLEQWCDGHQWEGHVMDRSLLGRPPRPEGPAKDDQRSGNVKSTVLSKTGSLLIQPFLSKFHHPH